MKTQTLVFGLFLLTGSLLAGAAHAQETTTLEIDRGIALSIDASGADVTYYNREKLKATTKTQGDFNLANKLVVTFGDTPINGVQSIEGLETESAIVEYKDGEDGVSHTRPGNHKPGLFRIKRGFANTSEFVEWRKAAMGGSTQRKSGSIIVLDRDGRKAAEVQLVDCLPVDLVVAADPLDLKATPEEIVTLECLETDATVPLGTQPVTVKVKHDAAMAAIQNTR